MFNLIKIKISETKCWGWWSGLRHLILIFFGSITTDKVFKRFNVYQRICSKKLIMIMCIVIIIFICIKPMVHSIFLRDPEILTCHYEVDGDALHSAEDSGFMPPAGSIFFHETSCRGELNSRQACSVESAARVHSEREVYVLFSGPVTNYNLRNTILAKLEEIPNIHLARIHIEEYAKGTPLESLVVKKNVLIDSWPIEYMSVILRFLTLRKWSGIYLDLDMLVARDLRPLGENWVACEDHKRVNSAAVAIDHNEVGLNVLDDIILEFAKSYNPKNWDWSGEDAVMRVLRRRCLRRDVYEWSYTTCQGFQVWAPSFVFPIHYSFSDEYFKVNASLGEIMTMSTYAYHLWNKRTRNLKIVTDSLYDSLAKDYCPTVYTHSFKQDY